MPDQKSLLTTPVVASAQLSVREAAGLARVSPSQIYKLCRERVLPHTRVGTTPGRGPIRISEDDLRTFLAERRVEPGRGEDLTGTLKHLKVS